MVGLIPKLPRRAWANVAKWTIGISVLTTAISLMATIGVATFFKGIINPSDVALALTLPPLLAAPLTAFVSVRHQHLQLVNDELKDLAFRDALLGCMNRRGFTASLDIALQYASEHRPCALLVIDADNFKRINDRFGHDLGDDALRMIVDAIKTAIRSADILGRIGGEEFAAFLPGADEERARTIAKRICSAVSGVHFAPDGEHHQLSVSVGGVIVHEPADFRELYRTADRHLYAAKKSGRNCVAFDVAA